MGLTVFTVALCCMLAIAVAFLAGNADYLNGRLRQKTAEMELLRASESALKERCAEADTAIVKAQMQVASQQSRIGALIAENRKLADDMFTACKQLDADKLALQEDNADLREAFENAKKAVRAQRGTAAAP